MQSSRKRTSGTQLGHGKRDIPEFAISPRYIRRNPRSMYARVPQMMAQFVLKKRKIVPYHRDSPNTRNGTRLRSPSPIMAPDFLQNAPSNSVLYSCSFICATVSNASWRIKFCENVGNIGNMELFTQQTHLYWLRSFASVDSPSIFLISIYHTSE